MLHVYHRFDVPLKGAAVHAQCDGTAPKKSGVILQVQHRALYLHTDSTLTVHNPNSNLNNIRADFHLALHLVSNSVMRRLVRPCRKLSQNTFWVVSYSRASLARCHWFVLDSPWCYSLQGILQYFSPGTFLASTVFCHKSHRLEDDLLWWVKA